MKIALSFLGCHTRGGIERVLLETANHLAQRGHGVHVLAADFDAAALHPGIVPHPVAAATRPPLWRMFTYARNCRSALDKLDADVHASFGVLSPPDGIFLVPSVHRAWIDTSRRLRSRAARMRQACNPLHAFLLRLEAEHFAERRYRKLIVPTAQVRADLQRFYGVPSRDILVIPTGFSSASFNPARAEAERPAMRGKLGYTPGDFVVLFAANEIERKGLPQLLRALALLENPRVRLLAVTGRANTAACQRMIRRLALGDRVRIVGAQTDLTPWYAAADLFALPTQYEAWGLVIVEALACGTPVLTSRAAGASIAVCEGFSGELLDDPCNPAEIAAKLVRLAGNAQPTRSDIAASVTCYAWESILPQYESAFQSAL